LWRRKSRFFVKPPTPYEAALKVKRVKVEEPISEPLVTTFTRDSVFVPEEKVVKVKEKIVPREKTPYEKLAQEQFGPVSVLPSPRKPKMQIMPEGIIADAIKRSISIEEELPKKTIRDIVGVTKQEVEEKGFKPKLKPTDVTNTARSNFFIKFSY